MVTIFLDIDGVLNSTQYCNKNDHIRKTDSPIKYRARRLDPKIIKIINSLSNEYKNKFRVVLSSSWILLGIEYVNEIFKYAKLDIEIVDDIGMPTIQIERPMQILNYIGLHGIDNFIIIDNDIKGFDMFRYFEERNLLSIDCYDGFTEENKKELIEKLNV